jgi:hypothetical protein
MSTYSVLYDQVNQKRVSFQAKDDDEAKKLVEGTSFSEPVKDGNVVYVEQDADSEIHELCRGKDYTDESCIVFQRANF